MSLNGIGELMTVVGLVVLLYGEYADKRVLRSTGKPFAALGFLVAAVGFGAFESGYGKIIFVGLVLGALGDVFLLGRGKQSFIDYMVRMRERFDLDFGVAPGAEAA